MVWDRLDAAYRLAKDNGLPFQMHVMVWGNQQPEWIRHLPPDEQRAEIEEWFTAVAARYPDIDIVEVVNEPLHDPPTQDDEDGGNYAQALGGDGESGWDQGRGVHDPFDNRSRRAARDGARWVKNSVRKV